MGFHNKRERLDSTPNTTNKRRNRRQGTGEGVGRDIIRWKIIKSIGVKGRARFWLR